MPATVLTVTIKGREWKPRSASLEAEAEAIRRLAPYNRDSLAERCSECARPTPN